ncbi:MAG TPA: putative Ig domain-containing protein, partial [Methanosarcina sp.]|nr:putative Ig domain-containing protein [Methanosarcina sp.]
SHEVYSFQRNIFDGKVTLINKLTNKTGAIIGLNYPDALTISPDDKFFYSASPSDGTIDSFAIAADGKISFQQALKDGATLNGVAVTKLAGVKNLKISPDGKYLYAAAGSDNSLVVFSRNIYNNQLSLLQQLTDGTTQGSKTLDALAGAASIAVHPSGKFIYVAAKTDNGISYFINDQVQQTSSVTIIAPSNYARFPSGSNITLQASAFEAGVGDVTNKLSLRNTQTGEVITSPKATLTNVPAGSYKWKAFFYDSSNGFHYSYINFDVMQAENQLPFVTSTPVLTAYVGLPYEYQIVAVDPDKEVLSYSATTIPAGAALDPNTGLIKWTPTNAQTGSNRFDIRISDTRSGVVIHSFVVTVVAPDTNRAPILTSASTVNVVENQALSYVVTASDPDGDSVAIRLIQAPAGLSLDTQNRLIWTPDSSAIGSQEVSVEL